MILGLIIVIVIAVIAVVVVIVYKNRATGPDAAIQVQTVERDKLAADATEKEKELAARVDELSAVVAARDAAVATLTSANNGLTGQINNLNSQIGSLNNQVSGLKSQVNGLTGQISGLNNQLKTCSNAPPDVAQLNARIITLESEIASLNAQIVSLRAQINAKDTAIADLNVLATYLRKPAPFPGAYYGTAKTGTDYSGPPFFATCNDGPDDYIAGLNVQSDKRLDAISIKCKSGAVYGPFGRGTSKAGSLTCPDGVSGFNVNHYNGINMFNPICKGSASGPVFGAKADGGIDATYACPSGKRLKSIAGIAGKAVGTLGFICA